MQDVLIDNIALQKVLSCCNLAYLIHHIIPSPEYIQDVWIIRSLWHGISDAGMMEFSNVDNSRIIPPGVGKFPPNKKKGSLEGSYSAIRMCHEMTSLLALDVLQGGGEYYILFLFCK